MSPSAKAVRASSGGAIARGYTWGAKITGGAAASIITGSGGRTTTGGGSAA
ncbi:hypothetical protein [Lichenicola sp.]|uniref:hypothetical protein n=1 Tax=Lichenicola sp. TaxID=2804529 RepID=UPI003B00DE38